MHPSFIQECLLHMKENVKLFDYDHGRESGHVKDGYDSVSVKEELYNGSEYDSISIKEEEVYKLPIDVETMADAP
ncbi:hypothetical protein V9T40_004299 [Parthenolecanium corni]|uniref:Uncharacterized protein n=1 Tax=Parthenolecanium corni TaxID=536013 RepID=A0AAN9Y9F8_9HEMI